MKFLFASVLVMLSTAAFSQATLDGNWKGTRETPNGAFEINYVFKVQGKELTGTWKTQFGEAKIENGKIDGKKFSFSVSFNEMKIENTGEQTSDDEITVKNERGETKLKRVKAPAGASPGMAMARR